MFQRTSSAGDMGTTALEGGASYLLDDDSGWYDDAIDTLDSLTLRRCGSSCFCNLRGQCRRLRRVVLRLTSCRLIFDRICSDLDDLDARGGICKVGT